MACLVSRKIFFWAFIRETQLLCCDGAHQALLNSPSNNRASMRPVGNLHYSGSSSCKVKPLSRTDAARHESITAELRPRPAKLKSMPIGRFEAGVPDSIRYYLARSADPLNSRLNPRPDGSLGLKEGTEHWAGFAASRGQAVDAAPAEAAEQGQALRLRGV